MPATKRLRLSAEKAHLITQLSDLNVEKLLRLLREGDAPQHAPRAAEAVAIPKPQPRYIKPFTGGDPGNVLVIPDLHAPFIREGFLEFCREQQQKWNCGKVVAIGDLADFHAISYHESDPDGLSAGDEHQAAKAQLAKLFAMFPGTLENPVYCTLGNHDLLISRKAKTAGLSSHFVRSLGEVYGAPDSWKFVDEVEIDDVVYRHGGAGGNAQRMAMHSRRSTVQGHLHSEFFTQWLVSERDAIFGCQVASGIDDKAYAFAYGRPYPKKSAIGCAVILNGGKTPVNLLMPLG